MTDSGALRFWIAEKGYKLKVIAKEMSITPYALQRKIDNQSEFKVSEIAVLSNEFGMDPVTRDMIFFSQRVE